MKNSLSDLNNALFEQIERLQDDQSEEELRKEIARSKAVCSVATKILNVGSTMLEAARLVGEYGADAVANVPLLDAKQEDTK